MTALQEIDNLLGLPPGGGQQQQQPQQQQQAAAGGEMNERMAIDAIQEALMREVNTSVNTPQSNMNTRPTLSSPMMPNSQVNCLVTINPLLTKIMWNVSRGCT